MISFLLAVSPVAYFLLGALCASLAIWHYVAWRARRADEDEAGGDEGGADQPSPPPDIRYPIPLAARRLSPLRPTPSLLDRQDIKGLLDVGARVRLDAPNHSKYDPFIAMRLSQLRSLDPLNRLCYDSDLDEGSGIGGQGSGDDEDEDADQGAPS